MSRTCGRRTRRDGGGRCHLDYGHDGPCEFGPPRRDGRPAVGDVKIGPVPFPDALADALRARADEEGISVNKAVRLAVETWLAAR